ncbi:hypothetical protein HBI23_069560 [Parastagonospora nodorum]|nr:hypothetical protein HBI23_069560 [Parastagonospora nodorum]
MCLDPSLPPPAHYSFTQFAILEWKVALSGLSITGTAVIALHDIYVSGGGFPKDSRYSNFNLGPIVSIFSSTDTIYRDRRAKAVASLFAPNRLRSACEHDQVIGISVSRFIHLIQEHKKERISFDLVDICARLSIDVVTEYLLGEPYGGFREIDHLSPRDQQYHKLSANPFIFAIVAFSRFSLLPKWLFTRVYSLSTRLASDDEVKQSFRKLDSFISGVMSRLEDRPDHKADQTYQSRLLAAGIDPSEVAAQCKAVTFAGADSTAVILTTIIFHLIAHQKASTGPLDPETVPYLRAVVKEGLRLGMANPTRLTRVVPPSTALNVEGYAIPAGTVVGCAAYTLHHDPNVFPEPFEFKPERWIENRYDRNPLRLKMEMNMMPFGVGLRGCIGKNLAMRQLYETISAVCSTDTGLLEGARIKQQHIEVIEWFNGEIKGHRLDVHWE